jgi:hypothetical protein
MGCNFPLGLSGIIPLEHFPNRFLELLNDPRCCVGFTGIPDRHIQARSPLECCVEENLIIPCNARHRKVHLQTKTSSRLERGEA